MHFVFVGQLDDTAFPASMGSVQVKELSNWLLYLKRERDRREQGDLIIKRNQANQVTTGIYDDKTVFQTVARPGDLQNTHVLSTSLLRMIDQWQVMPASSHQLLNIRVTKKLWFKTLGFFFNTY